MSFRKLSLPLCIISGILLYIAFSYNTMWWIVFFAYTPLFYVLLKSELEKKQLFLYIMSFSMFYYCPLVHWLFNVSVMLPFRKAVSLTVMLLAIVIIALLQGFYIFISLIFFRYIKNNTMRDAILLGVLFALAEFLQRITPVMPFPWSQTGVMVAPFTPFIQSASLFGTSFVSLIILLFNSFIAYAVINKKNKTKTIKTIVIAVSILLINTTYGIIRILDFKNNLDIEVLSVQGNFSDLDKWYKSKDEMLTRYKMLTAQYIKEDTKLIVWPETALPYYINTENNIPLKTELTETAQQYNISLITGCLYQGENKEKFNSVFSFEPDGTILGPYSKMKLVPFGEYIPIENITTKLLRPFSDYFETGVYVTKGGDYTILDTSAGKISSIICYESIFPDVARKSTKQGGQLIIAPSNDSWFGKSSALYQHYCHNILRAVENNRYLISASNTGITAIISPRGETLSQAETFKPTATSAKISVLNTKTLYYYTGDTILILYVIAFLLCLLSKFVKNKHFH